MEKSKGLVTIPTDLDVVPQTLELMKLWVLMQSVIAMEQISLQS